MKNKYKWFGAMRSIAIIALIVAIGMVTTTCRSDGGGDDSDGGMTWTPVPSSPFYPYGGVHVISQWKGLGSKFVAGGRRFTDSDGTVHYDIIGYSTDGINWTGAQSANDIFEKDDTIYAMSSSSYVAGGSSGKMAYSSDGIKWTSEASPFGSEKNDVIRAIASGNIYVVAVGQGEDTDGKKIGKIAYTYFNRPWTWNAVTTDPNTGTDNIFSAPINTIVWGSDKFVAGGANGKMAYSIDGKTWTPVWDSTFGNDSINAIAWSWDGKFVAVGGDNKMAYSTNGVNWIPVSNPFKSRSDIKVITWGGTARGGRFVAGANSPGTGTGSGYRDVLEMAYSDNGIDWTIIVDTTLPSGTISALAWSVEPVEPYTLGRFVAAASDGMWYSDWYPRIDW